MSLSRHHRVGTIRLVAVPSRCRGRAFTSKTRNPFLRARLEERRRNSETPSTVPNTSHFRGSCFESLGAFYGLLIDSPTYPFAVSPSRRSIRGTRRDFLQADSLVPHAVLQPRTAVRNDTLDRLLPTLTPTTRTHTSCPPGDLMPCDMSSAAEVWASTPKLPGIVAVHAANNRFGGLATQPSAFSSDAWRDTEPLTLRHRLRFTRCPLELPMSLSVEIGHIVPP